MSWDKIYSNMAFQAHKGDFARYQNLKDAITTLYCYLEGTARVYEVTDALRFLEYNFLGTKGPCQAFRRMLTVEDEQYREMVGMECIQAIERATVRVKDVLASD